MIAVLDAPAASAMLRSRVRVRSSRLTVIGV